MIKINSKMHNTEVLVNEARIQYIAPTFEGCILHFDTGSVLPSLMSIEQIELLLQKPLPTQKSALQPEQNVVNLNLLEDKVWPDEFPDDFPRFKNGTIIKTSKKYLEFIKNKETDDESE